MTVPPGPADIVIAVCTFRRPVLLQGLLAAIRMQELPAPPPRVHVVVVDNSTGYEARPVVNRACLEGMDVTYVAHGAGNISSGRNEALRHARTRAPLVVLLDDDEVPEPWGLAQLLAAGAATSADIVTGPVIARFPPGAPAWLVGQEELYSVTGHQDGAWLTEAITGNVSIRTACLDRTGVEFDELLGLSGGEDQLFFRSARDRGATIVYAARALVHEVVPLERLSLRYLLRREYRKGGTLGLLDRSRPGWPRGRPLRRLASSGWWAVSGVFQVLVHVLRGRRADAARGAMRVARSCGMLAGLTGRTYALYAGHSRP